MDWPILAIKVLRRLPHSEMVNRHLDRCAQLDVLFAAPGVPRLSVAHVLGLSQFPTFDFSTENVESERFHAPGNAENAVACRGGDDPISLNS